MSKHLFVSTILMILFFGQEGSGQDGSSQIRSSWISKDRIMVIYNKDRMDSVAKEEPDSFSRDMGEWYMKQYGMPTTHLWGYGMGKKFKWDNPGAFDFLKAVADYIKANNIQIVLLAPGTPILIRDKNNKHYLALDSLVGHSLWFAHVIKEAPTCNERKSVAANNSNLYFPYLDMKDGASPFAKRTNDASNWCKEGALMVDKRWWYESLYKDLRDHPSVRPYGRVGLPYFIEGRMENDESRVRKKMKRRTKKQKAQGIKLKPEYYSQEESKAMNIPKENSKMVKALVLGGMKATTSIEKFNKQSERCLLFFGRETNTASFIDVESSINEAMAQYSIRRGIKPELIKRVKSSRGWSKGTGMQEPKWDHRYKQFMEGMIPKLNPLIFTGGGVNNVTEIVRPWPESLDVNPGLIAAVSVSNGKAFAGSLLRRGATTIIVNIHHPANARTHAWFSVYRQLIDGATICEAMMTSGGSERGGYITGSIWGDPLYAPFGKNAKKHLWFIGDEEP